MKNIRWGIIGLGRFGAIHASAIQSLPGCDLVYLCNHNPEKLKQAATDFPDTRVTTDYHELLNCPDVDVVSITTHWQQHIEIAMAALASGKHVLLEKPMASTTDECRRLVRAAEQSSGYLMVGHVCRFDPRVTLAKEAIEAGRIGRILSMHAKRNLPLAPGHIRLDRISPLMGDGIHDADLMMWFQQRSPSRVYARHVHTGRFKYPELGWAMLEFEDQAVGVIETVWCLPENVPTVIDARMEVVGTDGMLTIDCSHTGFHLINGAGNAMADTVYWPQQHGVRVGALTQEISYLADCVRRQSPPSVITPAEAAEAVIVMETAERSARAGCPLEVPGLRLDVSS